MKTRSSLTRRSFVARVTGGGVMIGGAGALPLLVGDALAYTQASCTDRDPTPNRSTTDPVGRGVGCQNTTAPTQNPYSGCSDNDPTDDYQRGRRCSGPGRGGTTAPTQNPYTGYSDRDPTDDFQRGRNRPSGGGTPSGCSDSDPRDPGGQGVNCGGRAPPPPPPPPPSRYQTGRRERRYEICWIDRATTNPDDCNIQTYSEWAITYSDGSVEFDFAESPQRRAEMERRGYRVGSWRWVVNDWDPSWNRN